jgi:hypothetical protein
MNLAAISPPTVDPGSAARDGQSVASPSLTTAAPGGCTKGVLALRSEQRRLPDYVGWRTRRKTSGRLRNSLFGQITFPVIREEFPVMFCGEFHPRSLIYKAFLPLKTTQPPPFHPKSL